MLNVYAATVRGSGSAMTLHLRQAPLLNAPATQGRPDTTIRRISALAEHRGSSSGSSGPGRRGKHHKKARAPGLFEVQDISPPKRSLGIHALPPTTHNGDEIEVEGSSYVVQSVVMQFKLVRGRYQREHARLEVQHTGRFLYNTFLEELYRLDSSHLQDRDDR